MCALGLAFAAATAGSAHAGGKSAGFKVNIVLNASESGGCLHQTGRTARDAALTVTCPRGQFVNIAPVLDRSSWRAMGPPVRLQFASAPEETLAEADVERDSRTVTSLRIARAPGGLMEMLVSF